VLSSKLRNGGNEMPVWKEDRSHFFVCDVCERQIIVEERKGASWDEVRMIPANLKEDGWILNRRRGGSWEAQCPDCSPHSGYRTGPDGFDF